jgi:hypothetical protein
MDKIGEKLRECERKANRKKIQMEKKQSKTVQKEKKQTVRKDKCRLPRKGVESTPKELVDTALSLHRSKPIATKKLVAQCSSGKKNFTAPGHTNFYCGGCGIIYEESKGVWLRCRSCRDWWELECSGMLGKSKSLQDQFVCSDCV